ncbi:MAG: hypothetical protein DIU70_004560 [Bacillota bacterium]|nr:MAG: hypothetical protein DIU70_05980 [Bacillota bacterium]
MDVVLDLSGPTLRVAGFRGRTPVAWAEHRPPAGSPPDAQAIRHLLAAAGLRPGRVEVVLPPTLGLARVIPLPPVRPWHLRPLLRQEVQALLGLAPDELIAAWVRTRRPDGGLDLHTFLFHRTSVERYLQTLREAGLRPRGLYALPATLRAALAGPDGTVAYLGEDGTITCTAFTGGLPRLVLNTFPTPGTPAALEVARGLRTVRNQAGLPPDSPLAVTGPGAGPELRAELKALGLPCLPPPAVSPHRRRPAAGSDADAPAFDADAFVACLGARRIPGLPRLPRRPAPLASPDEAAIRRTVALALAAATVAATGEVGQAVLRARLAEVEARLDQRGTELRAFRGAEELVDQVLQQREELERLRQDLGAVPPEPADWLLLAPALAEQASWHRIGLHSARALVEGRGKQATALEVEGSAPDLAALESFVKGLSAPPFRGAYVVEFSQGETGVGFRARVMLAGGDNP